MINTQRIYWFLGILVLTITAWVLAVPYYVGLCPPYGEEEFYSCVDKYIHIGEPSAVVFSALLISFFLALFTKPTVFRAWKVFSLVYLFAAVLLIFLSPQSSGNIINIDREIVSWFLSIGFVIISLLLIAYKSWRLKSSQ